MRRVSRIKVNGLFGHVNHDVDLSQVPPITIISGLNGSGKTHLLRLLDAVVSFKLAALAKIQFNEFEIAFSDGHTLKVRPKGQSGDSVRVFEFFGRTSPSEPFKRKSVPFDKSDDSRRLPEWLLEMPDGSLYDTTSDRMILREVAVRRYRLADRQGISVIKGSWLEEFYQNSNSILIDTQRLDSSIIQNAARVTAQGSATSRIKQYIEQISAQLNEARRASHTESMDADQSFASRVMKRSPSTSTIKEGELKTRYQRIADQQAELHANGLSIRPVDVTFPEGKVDVTARRILNVFLDDWERRLAPLLPVHEKVKLLREIVDEKFTGKEMSLSERGVVRFRTLPTGRPLAVASLSSGEQHLIALFAMLLFSAKAGSLVLIDEPEISMHAAWKHAFLEDIQKVANISDLQIVLATHSSAIIRGRWDLVREIDAQHFEGEDEPQVDLDELDFESEDIEV
ncbi:AAA family ATPase [Streptomyces sp. EN16]|uniref:AAA family ATPase n=1 Tax=Streptomyces sp. EN16 TaxID=212773 RepID=UPI0009A04E93|nr:AAA family ATPase [Streptomyces sp. EN16]